MGAEQKTRRDGVEGHRVEKHPQERSKEIREM